MAKEYYCRQKFLFQHIDNTINLEKYYASEPEFLQDYREQINLFDDDNILRSIKISELDCTIDNLNDLESLINQIKHITTLYILDNRKKIDNPIISDFQNKSLKAYICLFEKYGMNCKVVDIL